jgi:hypothetical protein
MDWVMRLGTAEALERRIRKATNSATATRKSAIDAINKKSGRTPNALGDDASAGTGSEGGLEAAASFGFDVAGAFVTPNSTTATLFSGFGGSGAGGVATGATAT